MGGILDIDDYLESYDEDYDDDYDDFEESYYDDEDEYMEGANLDSRRIMMTVRRDVKASIYQIKAYEKKKDYKAMRKEIKRMRGVINKSLSDIDKIQDASGAGSAIIGFFTSFGLELGRGINYLLIGLIGQCRVFQQKNIPATLGRAMLGIAQIIDWLKRAKENVDEIIRNIRRNSDRAKKVTMSDLNQYINNCKIYIKAFAKPLDILEKSADKLAYAQGK